MNNFKIVFTNEDTESLLIPINSSESITKELLMLLQSNKPEDISKILYPANMPKSKKDILGTIKGFTISLGIALEESKVMEWESGGFGSAVDYLSSDYLATKGLDSSNKQHIEIAKEYVKLLEAASALNAKMPKGASKVGCYWHSLKEFKIKKS